LFEITSFAPQKVSNPYFGTKTFVPSGWLYIKHCLVCRQCFQEVSPLEKNVEKNGRKPLEKTVEKNGRKPLEKNVEKNGRKKR